MTSWTTQGLLWDHKVLSCMVEECGMDWATCSWLFCAYGLLKFAWKVLIRLCSFSPAPILIACIYMKLALRRIVSQKMKLYRRIQGVLSLNVSLLWVLLLSFSLLPFSFLFGSRCPWHKQSWRDVPFLLASWGAQAFICLCEKRNSISFADLAAFLWMRCCFCL